ncbi:MAG: hypothetical protein WD077_11775 [Bacteroidia bacterium]
MTIKQHKNLTGKDETMSKTMQEQGMTGEQAEEAAKMEKGKNYTPVSNQKDEESGNPGERPQYENWTEEQLRTKAAEKNIDNYQKLDKTELIEALRNLPPSDNRYRYKV